MTSRECAARQHPPASPAGVRKLWAGVCDGGYVVSSPNAWVLIAKPAAGNGETCDHVWEVRKHDAQCAEVKVWGKKQAALQHQLPCRSLPLVDRPAISPCKAEGCREQMNGQCSTRIRGGLGGEGAGASCQWPSVCSCSPPACSCAWASSLAITERSRRRRGSQRKPALPHRRRRPFQHSSSARLLRPSGAPSR